MTLVFKLSPFSVKQIAYLFNDNKDLIKMFKGRGKEILQNAELCCSTLNITKVIFKGSKTYTQSYVEDFKKNNLINFTASENIEIECIEG